MLTDYTALSYGCIVLATILYILRWFKNCKYNSVPTVGPSAPLISYLGAIRFVDHAKEMLEEGYTRYGGRPFKIANRRYWQYIVSSPEHVDELRRAGDDELSATLAANEPFDIGYTMGEAVANNTYHVPILRTVLTRKLEVLTDDIYDEVCHSFTDFLPPTDQWRAFPAFDSVIKIVARSTNRIFVGFPHCRNPEFLDISVTFTKRIAIEGLLLSQLPTFLKPLYRRFMSNLPNLLDRAQAILGPTIQERKALQGDKLTDPKPDDLLQWIVEASQSQAPEQQDPRTLVTRLLFIGFVAINNSASSFTEALYRLAASPEYMQQLREEAEGIVSEEGWSKSSLQRMHKIDSFLKECQRMEGLSCLFLPRKAVKDFTFSDGTAIPRGNYVATASIATHYENAYYTNPFVFDPWRFTTASDEVGGDTIARQQMVSANHQYLPFGLGRRACPGRFFAANQLKIMMAYLVTTYDVKLESPGEIPPPTRYTSIISPNRTARVMFRRREK